jgi:hypothetical protein
MKKIMMSKYGFVRWPEADFSDDGNRFTCYKAGDRVRVSKLVSDGVAYISASINGCKLPYEVYSSLPHYKHLDDLNGVSCISLTDDQLVELYFTCMAYEKEYTAAEASLVMPTFAEIREQCIKVKAKRVSELAEVEALFGSKAIKLALTLVDWQWKTLREYLAGLAKVAAFDIDEYAKTMLNTRRSIDFVKECCGELGDSYYYKWLKDVFKSVE